MRSSRGDYSPSPRARDLLVATQAYARARADAARALELTESVNPPFVEYVERDSYVRERAKQWLQACREDFLAAIAEECLNVDGRVADVPHLDADLPVLSQLHDFIAAEDDRRRSIAVAVDGQQA